MNGIGSFFLMILITYGSFVSLLANPEAPEDTADFSPVARFIVTSDSHITTIGDVQSFRLQRMIKLGYDIAKKDKEYNKLDAVLVAGDVTDMGTKIAFGSIKAAIKPVIKGDTQFLATVSTSHDDRNLGKESLELYEEIMGQETDFHRVINGFKDCSFVRKFNLKLCRMHVNVNDTRVHFKEQNANRKALGRNIRGVCLFDCRHCSKAFNVSAVYKYVL